ncbi:unnamed protein product [Cylicocyclus nassatus]|uniref:ATP-dependent DNA helicase n=1 Tax=Cylicocyclus nassatus TaxID=53992 RepID=A0AA36GNK7_CYLNA|nr:unnamed protein product [Cylicocyclus nassatus]
MADELDAASLIHIRKILEANGFSLRDCGLSTLQVENEIIEGSVDIDELDMDEVAFSEAGKELSMEQQRILDTLMREALQKKSAKKRFFVYGKAAATLLQDGRTAHSAFRLPVSGLFAESTANVDASSLLAQRFRSTDVIVWDEISMQTKFAVECAEKMLSCFAFPRHSFRWYNDGFRRILVTQFLPVVENGSKPEILNHTLKYSGLWQLMDVLTLETNMRVLPGNEEFAGWLRREKELIDWLYTPELIEDVQQLSKVALLSIRNDDVLSKNHMIVEKLRENIEECNDLDIYMRLYDDAEDLAYSELGARYLVYDCNFEKVACEELVETGFAGRLGFRLIYFYSITDNGPILIVESTTALSTTTTTLSKPAPTTTLKSNVTLRWKGSVTAGPIEYDYDYNDGGTPQYIKDLEGWTTEFPYQAKPQPHDFDDIDYEQYIKDELGHTSNETPFDLEKRLNSQCMKPRALTLFEAFDVDAQK